MTDELPRTVDLNWIARTLLNMQADLRSLRDDMLVTAAVLNRLDNTQSAHEHEFELLAEFGLIPGIEPGIARGPTGWSSSFMACAI